MIADQATRTPSPLRRRFKPGTGTFVMAILLPVLGLYLIWPVIWIFVQSFNVSPHPFISGTWSVERWTTTAWQDPRLVRALFNTFFVWFTVALITFPVSITVAWALARVRMPFSYPLEYMFWIAYMIPGSAIAWIILLEPGGGLINVALRQLPFVDPNALGPLNIFSVAGIIWTNLMGNGIALKVMILTPAFRNMDMALEEAARVSGSSNIRTMLRITLPVMISPIILVFALQLLRIFSGFETEWLLGRPIKFFVYSTLIFEYVRMHEPPRYGDATVLASLTVLVIAFIVPLQRWIISRRRYTTITGSFRPGLIDVGRWKGVIFGSIVLIHVLLTFVQVVAFFLGSFMVRIGFFEVTPTWWTLDHWLRVYTGSLSDMFWIGMRTSLMLGFAAAILSPLLFSMLAYIIVRTRWRGRWLLDWMIWGSGAVPGILSGLGLLMIFLGTPGLSVIYGTIWALLLVVIIGGNTTGVNLSKSAIINVGFDMEEAARVAGAGWIRTYVMIWIPLMVPFLILLATLNFVSAMSSTSSVILLASRETQTLSILSLILASDEVRETQAAAIVNLHIAVFTLGVAAVARKFGLPIGIRHR